MTHSLTSSIFSKVCFVVLSRTLLAGEKMHSGGFVLNMLKKLKGLRLTLPSKSIVVAKQIGLGAIAYCI
ncbi:hypothetical protein D3C86_1690390 [compost metagenome]